MAYQHLTIRDIAAILGRNPSSISREVRKNFVPYGKRYLPRFAHARALEHRRHRGRTDRLKNSCIRSYVVSRLKRRWSPEQISHRIVHEIDERISHEAIYQFVYDQIYRKGYGEIKPCREDLRPYLRHKRKRRIRKGSRRCQRIFKPLGRSIDLRPAIVDTRKRIGDWEGDTVESCDHKPGINTLVERKTGLVMIH